MSLLFKTKDTPSYPDCPTIHLANFLIDNPIYLTVTFSVLAKKRKPMKNAKNRINNSIGVGDIIGDILIHQYYNLMDLFYDIDNDTLGHRRGHLLELIVLNIKPIKKTDNYILIQESWVFENGTQISPKDIDIVFTYEQIELIECKASLENFLHTPLLPDTKAKLQFMKIVKSLAAKYSKDCNLFLATYSANHFGCNSVLISNGFDIFSILSGDKIINRITI